MEIELAQGLPADAPALVVVVREGTDSLFPDLLDAALVERCRETIAAVGFDASAGMTPGIPAMLESGGNLVLLAGLANDGERAITPWEGLGARIVREADRLGLSRLAVILPQVLPDGVSIAEAVHAVALGAILAEPEDDLYRSWSSPRRRAIEHLAIVTPDEPDLRHAVQVAVIIGEAVRETRRRIMAPPNVMTPRALVAEAEALRGDGVEVTSFVGDDALTPDFPAIRAVGSGSAQESGAAIMRWSGNGSDQPVTIAFSAKGVTFDSGGLTPKGETDQRLMKIDMCGASSVIAVMRAVARLNLPINVVAGFGAVENVSGGAAYRSGDVIRMANGTYVEVTYPDAEGRLVMADINCYLASRYDPVALVNVAALTYTAIAALGDDCMALFSNDDRLAENILTAAGDVGETFWRLPVGPRYLALLDSHIADLKNMVAGNQWGVLAGSASAASEFLRHFAGDRQWANLDIFASIWRQKEHRLGPAGATGEPVRTLIQFLREQAA